MNIGVTETVNRVTVSEYHWTAYASQLMISSSAKMKLEHAVVILACCSCLVIGVGETQGTLCHVFANLSDAAMHTLLQQ